jgi:hypothetical protein
MCTVGVWGVRRRLTLQVGKSAHKERAIDVAGDRKKIFRRIRKKYNLRCGLYSVSSIQGLVVVFCDHGNELTCPMKGGRFVD